VIELYPLRDKPSSGLRLGIRVANLDAAVEALRRVGAEIVHADHIGRSAVVRDPDGHEVALRQPAGNDADA
jgi:predicted enzyme related to lactoylglutathione lyase